MSGAKAHLIILLLIVLVLAACGAAAQPTPQSSASVAPIALNSDLKNVDVCKAIPRQIMEAALGSNLVSAPEPFAYYDAPGSSGCTYDAGKNKSGDARFAYVVLTPPEIYNQQPLYKNQAVSGIGDAAYFNNGADARQLWVKVGPKAALVVAIGDVPNEPALKSIAQQVVAAIQK